MFRLQTVFQNLIISLLYGSIESNDEVVPVFVVVIYTVTINDVEYGPFQQFTNDDSSIVWRKHQLTEEEMADGNGVKIQVCIFEFHC